MYEPFCAGHSEALDLLRKVQGQPEWDMYEKRCALVVSDERALENSKSGKPPFSRRHSSDAPKTHSRLSRLTMRDFLITPIQRICRYPLLLHQLEAELGHSAANSLPHDLEGDIVTKSVNSMKQVAAKVDEARRRTEIATKSRLIVERVSEQVREESTRILQGC